MAKVPLWRVVEGVLPSLAGRSPIIQASARPVEAPKMWMNMEPPGSETCRRWPPMNSLHVEQMHCQNTSTTIWSGDTRPITAPKEIRTAAATKLPRVKLTRVSGMALRPSVPASSRSCSWSQKPLHSRPHWMAKARMR